MSLFCLLHIKQVEDLEPVSNISCIVHVMKIIGFQIFSAECSFRF